MIDYRFLLPAEEEMTEASQFHEAASTGLGADLLDDVQRVLSAVCESPLLGPEVGGKFRRVLLHRFPFSIIYSIEAGYPDRCCGAPAAPAQLLAEST